MNLSSIDSNNDRKDLQEKALSASGNAMQLSRNFTVLGADNQKEEATDLAVKAYNAVKNGNYDEGIKLHKAAAAKHATLAFVFDRRGDAEKSEAHGYAYNGHRDAVLAIQHIKLPRNKQQAS
ncbi:MAG: hypothetical protein M0R50_08665 [Candidatus Cloacimonetes bacterium]|nr:hypothetical protein [Candidatus Cloacimonadota bacterium]